MTTNLDLVGQRFGKLTCVEKLGMNATGQQWRLRCDCGGETVKASGDLRRQRRPARSCGCGINDPRPLVTKHGHASNARGQKASRTYLAWTGAKARCHKPSHRSFAHYGGRGIEMCERWRNSFEAFLADMGECPPALTLDRIDNGRGYEPGNCRWATITEQNRNRAVVRFADGVPFKVYAAQQGVRYTSFLKQIGRGLSPAEAVAHVRANAVKPLPRPA